MAKVYDSLKDGYSMDRLSKLAGTSKLNEAIPFRKGHLIKKYPVMWEITTASPQPRRYFTDEEVAVDALRHIIYHKTLWATGGPGNDIRRKFFVTVPTDFNRIVAGDIFTEDGKIYNTKNVAKPSLDSEPLGQWDIQLNLIQKQIDAVKEVTVEEDEIRQAIENISPNNRFRKFLEQALISAEDETMRIMDKFDSHYNSAAGWKTDDLKLYKLKHSSRHRGGGLEHW